MDAEPVQRRSQNLRNTAVESILEVTSNFLYVEDVEALLQKIVKTVSETFGLAVATIGIREKDTGLFAIRATHGFDPETEAKIKKVKYTKERMARDLRPELKIGRNAYYVTAESWEPDEEDLLFVVHPERLDRARRFPDEWHEMDFIDFLMYERSGSLLGYLEIEEPDNHKVPDEEKLRAIEVFSDLAAIAIQNAELYEELGEDRKKIALLIDLIGHDVNNYVQAVSGYLELAMGRKGVPEPSRKNMAKALDQVLNLNRLVSNVKLYARAESASGSSLQPMNIVAVVKEGFAAAETHDRQKTVELVLEDDGTPKMSMLNELAKEIFMNLFTNAIKFDQHETVVIDVTIEPTTEDKREVWCVSVADRGPGIEDSIKEKIFDRFTEASKTSIGTGLGLHIAKTLANSYRGRIWAEDRVSGDRSKGSVFKVILPRANA